MYIRLDVFAEMLGIKPGELRYTMRTGRELDGLNLPPYRQVKGATVMFEYNDALAFLEKWHARTEPLPPSLSDNSLIPLEVFADKVNIPRLALWQAVCRGKRLNGVLLPVAAKSDNGALMFDPDSVEQFVSKYRRACSNE